MFVFSKKKKLLHQNFIKNPMESYAFAVFFMLEKPITPTQYNEEIKVKTRQDTSVRHLFSGNRNK